MTPPGFHFDGTVTLGTVLTAVVIAISIATAYTKGTRWLAEQLMRFQITLEHHGAQLSAHSARMDRYEAHYVEMAGCLQKIIGRIDASDRRSSPRSE